MESRSCFVDKIVKNLANSANRFENGCLVIKLSPIKEKRTKCPLKNPPHVHAIYFGEKVVPFGILRCMHATMQFALEVLGSCDHLTTRLVMR